jgi:hypothetical protein
VILARSASGHLLAAMVGSAPANDCARQAEAVLSDAIEFLEITPILRIFDIAKADEFYLGFLGFSLDWEHRFDDNAPLYRQVSRGGLVLHLSEHHGDGSPGAHLRIRIRGIEAFHREISAKGYPYMGPGLETSPWNTREVGVIDPFSNHISFYEPLDEKAS